MNRIISTDPHCFLTVSGSGRTHLVPRLLRQHRPIFEFNFEQFVYFHNYFEPITEELLFSLGQQSFHRCQGIDCLVLDKVTASNKATILIIDYVYQDIFDTKEFLDFAISRRHQNLHLLIFPTIRIFKNNRFERNTDAPVAQSKR